MASLVTQVTIAGNLTRDPELRYTQSGLPVASFTIASTPRSLNKETKQYEDGEPLFQNCTLWGKPAEHFAASANKGTRVIAAGQLKARTYQTNAGETKTGIDLIVDEIGLSVMFAEVGTHSGATRQAPTYPATGGQTQVPDEEPW
jgi:single-strand DNA-binding protein